MAILHTWEHINTHHPNELNLNKRNLCADFPPRTFLVLSPGNNGITKGYSTVSLM